jgi:hypothetical protein
VEQRFVPREEALLAANKPKNAVLNHAVFVGPEAQMTGHRTIFSLARARRFRGLRN